MTRRCNFCISIVKLYRDFVGGITGVKPMLSYISGDSRIQVGIGRFTAGKHVADMGGGYRLRAERQTDNRAIQRTQVLFEWLGRTQRAAGSCSDNQVYALRDIAPGLPGAEVIQLIGTQNPIIIIVGRQLPDRVYCISGAIPVNLKRIDLKPVAFAHGMLQHSQTMVSGGVKRRSLPWVSSGDELYLIQGKFTPGGFGKHDVGPMDRIKAPAQKSYSSPDFSHSRGFRNSLSLASGLSASGCHI